MGLHGGELRFLIEDNTTKFIPRRLQKFMIELLKTTARPRDFGARGEKGKRRRK
jgi:hypothetical protein